MGTVRLTPRFVDAMSYAIQLHARQTRKGTAIPYISHLLAVTALVIEDGGDEDEAIAALLHDAVEDQGGYRTLDEIRRRYGDRVAAIVEGCSDAFGFPKPPWRERKQRYLEHLRQAGPSVLRVSLADKIHNARSILQDLKQNGEVVWKRFNGGKQGSLWYYHSLVEIFREISTSPMVAELAEIVSEMERLAAPGDER